MSKRSRMSGKASRKLFTKTASRSPSKNFSPAPMRGGIRL